MATVATLVAKLKLDTSEFKSELAKAKGSASSAGKGMMRAGAFMSAGITVPLALAGAAAIKFASDAEEARNKVKVIFGTQARIVEQWSETAAERARFANARFPAD